MLPVIRSGFRTAVCILMLFMIYSCNPGKTEQNLRAELERYPESTLQDVYKSWFQSVYGPGHLLNDSVGAYRYLSEELMQTTHYLDTTTWQPLGSNGHFGRLNLYVVASGKITKEAYFQAFMESAREYSLPEVTQWQEDWNEILSVMERQHIRPGNFDLDRRSLDSMLTSGQYVVHHSSHFLEQYDPHYRVISTAQYKKLIRNAHR